MIASTNPLRARSGFGPALPAAGAAGAAGAAAPPAEAAVLLRALDTLDLALAFHARSGRVQRSNPAFRRAVEAVGDGERLREEASMLAQAVWGKANAQRLEGEVRRVETRVLQLAAGPYRLCGAYLGAPLFGERASVLVSIELPPPDPLSTRRLKERFGLTPKQCRVARLLAEGLRTEEIAHRLFSSPHTVRHHIEKIKCRVGARTRAGIVHALLAP